MVPPASAASARGPRGRSLHGHRPCLSSRTQWRAGNQRRSMRTERSWLPFGSSMVKKRTAARSPSPSSLEGRFEIVDAWRCPCALNDADHGAARNAAGAEHVAGVRDVHALHRHVEVPRLLIRQRVHDRLAELQVRARRDRVQVADRRASRSAALPPRSSSSFDGACRRSSRAPRRAARTA